MAKSLKHYIPDGRGMTSAERQEYITSIEEELDDIYVGNVPLKTLAKSLEEDDSYYTGDNE